VISCHKKQCLRTANTTYHYRENKGGARKIKTYKVEIKRPLLKPRNSEMKE
jgi:hypothetical protein